MALGRTFLKGLGLNEEQISSIIEGHEETVEGLKGRIRGLEEKAAKADDLQKQLDAQKGGKDWKAEHDKLKSDFDAYKKQVAEEQARAGKLAEVRRLAKEAGLSEAGIEKAAKYTALDGLEMGEDGKAKNAADVVKNLRAEWPEHIVTTKSSPTPTKTPPEGGKPTRTREEIMAIKDTKERQAAMLENHELFGI